MEKAGHEQQQQGALKCPRCDSSNTKFCYYNNYSLSQPRHFCKACKRYWTRGGTLRNVPVGGGCRKNKHHRLKRPSTTPTTADPSSAPPHSQLLHQTDPAPSSNHHHHHHVNPLFHGLAYASAGSNPCDDVNNNNLALFSSRFLSSSRIPSSSGLFDLIQPPQMNNNALGLGFSSGGVMSTDNGFFTSNISNHDNNNTPFPISYTSIFSSSSSACSSTCTTTTMMPNNNSSVLGSSMMMMQHQQQQHKHKHKVVMNNNNGGRNMITSFDGGLVEVAPQMGVSGDDDVEGVVGASKDVKVELGQNRLLEFSWNNTTPSGGGGSGTNFQNQQHVMNGTMMSISDPNPNSNSLYWNSTAAAALGGSNWSDQPNNIAPSLTTSFSHLATKLL